VVLVSYNHLTRAGLQGILQNAPEITLIDESNGGEKWPRKFGQSDK